MAKNIKYETFSAGAAGSGQIDLRTGKVEFIHDDVSSDSNILPIGVSHVYSTATVKDAEGPAAFGKGFRLNLHQKLKKVKDDNNDTRYKLIDAACREHEFKERYYYLDPKGKKEYHKIVNGKRDAELEPKDITITIDGRLTYDDGTKVHEIFTDLRTDSGLFFRTSKLSGFRNADKIETRNEELVRVVEEIKSLKRSEEDLEYAINDYKNLDKQIALNKKQADLQAESLAMEEEEQSIFCASVKDQVALLDLNLKYNDKIRKKTAAIGELKIMNGSVAQDKNAVVNGNGNGLNSAYSFVFNPNGSSYTYENETGQMIDKLSLLAAYDDWYTKDSYGNTDFVYGLMTDEPSAASPTVKRNNRIKRVIQYLQGKFSEECEKASQDLREKSQAVSEKSLDDQKALRILKGKLLKTQTELQDLKKDYDLAEKEKLTERYGKLILRAEADLGVVGLMIEYKEMVRDRYKAELPVSYVSDGSVTYGFNEYGDPVFVWDPYGNYVSFVYGAALNGELGKDIYGNPETLRYDPEKIVKMIDAEEKETVFEYVDGMLDSIVDTMDRRIVFGYKNGNLVEIKYPNGDVSSFGYDNGLLNEMVSPTGMGVRLLYDGDGRPVRITDITSAESIDATELKKSKDAQDEEIVHTKDVLQINYNSSGTSTYVSYIEKDCKITYLFDSDGEWVSEYTEIDGVMKNIRTYDVGEKRCYFTMQQTKFDNNLMPAMPTYGGGTIDKDGNVTIESIGPASDRSVEWDIDLAKLPPHATDFILSGFAIANSAETLDRRRTEYCEEFDHQHLKDKHTDPAVNARRFELRAEVMYETKKKTFVASFDWRTKSKQFVAIPITLDEDENGEPIEPMAIIIAADYRDNVNDCIFFRPSLAAGDWVYVDTDAENRKIFECSNHKITDKTVDGEEDGKFITYAETFYEYDNKGNLIEEKTILKRNGKPRPFVTKYEYNKQSKLIRTTAHNGIVSENVYDKNGNAVKSIAYHISNPSSRFVSESEISEKGQVLSETDERGEYKTKMKYIDGTNIPIGCISPNGNELSLGLDPHTNDVLAISSSVNGEPNATKFKYTKGFLTRLSSGGTDYDYSYDGWGRTAEIKIANKPHVQFAFESDATNGNETVTATYASGEQYETVTDKLGKILSVNRIVDSVKRPFISYHYDKDGKPIKIYDHLSERSTEYVYNEDGSINCEKDGDVKTTTDRNIYGAAERVKYTLDGVGEHIYKNVYDEDGKLSSIVLPNEESEAIEYDDFGRVIGIEHPAHGEKITYYQNGDNATNIVVAVQHSDGRTTYRYDASGNISEVRENNRLAVRYSYDGLNRIIREDNVRLGKSYTFDYDTNGNILFKNTFKLTFNEHLRQYRDELASSLGIPTGKEFAYVYASKGNRDRLAAYNGEVCLYDDIGNPIVYRDKELKWANLSSLVKYDDVSFAYAASGLRMSKSRDGNKTKFYWASGRLIAERRTIAMDDLELGDHAYKCGSGCEPDCTEHNAYSGVNITDIKYLQGADGITGFVISKKGEADRTYYYRKNIQGDVTHILDINGNVRGEYAYDAWGNHKIIVNEDGVADINPFRYRSYYFDSETNLYYLRSRYYDPETGRFVNADGISELDPETINGLNLYAYCVNNPIMFHDPAGRGFWDSLKKLICGVGDFVVDNAVSVVQIAVGVALIATGVGAGLGTMLIIGGTLGMIGGAIGQICGGVGTMANGWGAISTGLSLFSFGIPGAIAGAALIVIGAATMIFGANEIAAGLTGTNYLQQLTGISDSTYNGLYMGLNIASSVGTIGGRFAMKRAGTVEHNGRTPSQRTPYAKEVNGYKITHYDRKGKMMWSRHNSSHGGGHKNPHWHTEMPHNPGGYDSYAKLLIYLIRRSFK